MFEISGSERREPKVAFNSSLAGGGSKSES